MDFSGFTSTNWAIRSKVDQLEASSSVVDGVFELRLDVFDVGWRRRLRLERPDDGRGAEGAETRQLGSPVRRGEDDEEKIEESGCSTG